MKSLSVLCLFALLAPFHAQAGGNVLNGPKNCRSLMGDSYEGGDTRAGKFDELCTKVENGDTLSDAETRELQERGVQLGHSRYGE